MRKFLVALLFPLAFTGYVVAPTIAPQLADIQVGLGAQHLADIQVGL